MTYVLGIDIGTIHTAAAVSRRENQVHLPPELIDLGGRYGTVPSVFHLGADGELSIGESAVRRGVDSPGRMIREFKNRVGDPVPVVVADTSYPPEDLFALMVRWIVDQVEDHEGAPPESVTVTHPASWGQYRISLVGQALAGVGLHGAGLLSEPEAAVLHHMSKERIRDGSTVAVYDLGGGTFDATVLRRVGDHDVRVLGTPADIEGLGGAEFDRLVFHHALDNIPNSREDLDTADSENSSAVLRLHRECTEAKEALSFNSEAEVSLLLPAAESRVRIIRSELEELISDPVRASIEALTEVLRTAGLEAGDLDTILLVGGSSRIPLVTQMVSTAFGRPIAIDTDPMASICLGAAAAAAARTEVAGDIEDPAPAAHVRRITGRRFVRREPTRAAPRAGHRRKSVIIATAAAVLIALSATAAQTPTDTAALTRGSGATQGEDTGSSSAGADGGSGEAPGTESDEPSRAVVREDLTTPSTTASSPSGGSVAGVDGDDTEPDREDSSSAERAQEESADPRSDSEQATPGSTPSSAPTTGPAPSGASDRSPEPTPSPVPERLPEPDPGPSPEVPAQPIPDPVPAPEPTPGPVLEPVPDPSPEPSGSTEENTDPTSLPSIDPEASVNPVPGTVEPSVDVSNTPVPDSGQPLTMNASAVSVVPVLE